MVTRRRFLYGLAAAAIVPPRAAWTVIASVRPSEVLIIRHGEEDDGTRSVHLNKKGRDRAAALPSLFPGRFKTPSHLFAASNTGGSHRSLETLEPLAHKLGLPINDSFAEDRADAIAKMLLAGTFDGPVLIAWHHGSIPELAQRLGVRQPPRWSDKAYDRIWHIRFTGTGVAFADLPMRLLPSDKRN